MALILNIFLGDALGSVRQLADASGAITLEKTYDPFGEGISNLGSAVTPYGFTSEYTSQGLIDLRSRIYFPRIMEFQQPDTLAPEPYNPQTLNRYEYALDNPIRYNDPSGHCVGAGGHDFPDGTSRMQPGCIKGTW